MPTIHTWNDKIVYDDDGWGYRVTEGDDGEVVVYYFDEREGGRVEKEHSRFYNSPADHALLKAIAAKFDEMDFADCPHHVGDTVKFNGHGEIRTGTITNINGTYIHIKCDGESILYVVQREELIC